MCDLESKSWWPRKKPGKRAAIRIRGWNPRGEITVLNGQGHGGSEQIRERNRLCGTVRTVCGRTAGRPASYR